MENNFKKCPFCGKVLPLEATFCPYCVHKLHVEENKKEEYSGSKKINWQIILISTVITGVVIVGLVVISNRFFIVDLNGSTGNNVAVENDNYSNTDSKQSDKTYNGDADYYDEDENKNIYGSQKETETYGSQKETETFGSQKETGASASKKETPESPPDYIFSTGSTLQWPVKGEIVLKYSMDSTIYFKSLDLYKCNPAINISSKAGTNVGAAADGVVTDVYISSETGTMVSVAIGGGYVTTYGLLNGVVVKKGDKVIAGQIIGTVAEPTACYVEEGSNLYFKLTKDNEPVDPMNFLAE